MPGKTLGERITMAEQHDAPAPVADGGEIDHADKDFWKRVDSATILKQEREIAALRALLVRAERWIDDVDHQDLDLLDDIRVALGMSHE